MARSESTKPLDWFVDSLLQTSGQLMLTVDHMARFPGNGDGKSAPEVLRELLVGALEQELEAFDPSELASAATLLAEAARVVGDELFLVEPGPDA
jgi:hypothetical protein